MHGKVESGNVPYKAVDKVWYVSPVQQLSTTQLLTCSVPSGTGERRRAKVRKPVDQDSLISTGNWKKGPK